jgi:pimeloyl-ACP methyl ester carboxylesterase
VLEERIENDSIPAKLYRPTDAQGILLLGHGGAKSKDSERFVGLSRLYAEGTGLAVVCIDAVDHGERISLGAGAGLPVEWHSRSVANMVSDWDKTARALSWIGPEVAYVGFSMGAIFGVPTVAALASIKAAVFVVGGVPAGGGIEDPPLRPLLLKAASKLGRSQVLMVNTTQDEIFPVEGVHELFDAIPGSNKRLMFWKAHMTIGRRRRSTTRSPSSTPTSDDGLLRPAWADPSQLGCASGADGGGCPKVPTCIR